MQQWSRKCLVVVGFVAACLLVLAWSHRPGLESFECKGARFDPAWNAETMSRPRVALGTDEADAPHQTKLAWSPETLPAPFAPPASM